MFHGLFGLAAQGIFDGILLGGYDQISGRLAQLCQDISDDLRAAYVAIFGEIGGVNSRDKSTDPGGVGLCCNDAGGQHAATGKLAGPFQGQAKPVALAFHITPHICAFDRVDVER